MIDGGLNQIIQKALPQFHWQRIETSTGLGVPDLNYCGMNSEGWIELKKATGNQFHVRPAQVAWIERRARHGGRVFIAVRHNDGLWMLGPEHARSKNLQKLNDPPRLICLGPQSSWQWQLIKELLVK